MSASSLIFEIIGIDHASRTFEKISKGMEKAEDRSKKLKIAAGIALGALAVGAVEFGKKSVEKFGEVGGETIRLQRILGGTATEVSRLRFAGEETGVSTDKLAIGFGILSKHLDANDKAWKSVGINAKDAHGKIRPMAELIPDIAEKFAKMPAGPHKTAEAMKLFGKSGKDLLPFLNKGKDGLKDLGKESDKFGNTMSDKDTAAVKKNIIAKRQLNAAVSGLEIQLGKHLVPVVVSVVTAITGAVVWFSNLSGGLKTAIGVVGAVIGVIFLVVKAVKAWTAVQAALNLVLDANPIGLIVIGIALLVAAFIIAWKHSQKFRDIVKGALHAVVVAAGAVGGWFKDIGGFIKDALKGIGKAIAKPFTDAFKVIMAGMHAVETAWQNLQNLLAPTKNTFTMVGGASTRHPVSRPKPKGARAHGGPVAGGSAYLVGENGPELFVPGQSGGIIPNGGGSRATSTGGTTINLYVTGAVDPLSAGKQIVGVLQKYVQATGPLQVKVRTA